MNNKFETNINIICLQLEDTFIKVNLKDEFLLQKWTQRLSEKLKDWDISNIPINNNVLNFIKKAKSKDQKIFLIYQEKNKKIAEKIIEIFPYFDRSIIIKSSDNLVELLKKNLGEKSFNFIGSSKKDIPIWNISHLSYTIHSKGFTTTIALPLEQIYEKNKIVKIIKMLRPHQWVKNFLIFAPIFLAHYEYKLSLWLILIPSFIAFSL